MTDELINAAVDRLREELREHMRFSLALVERARILSGCALEVERVLPQLEEAHNLLAAVRAELFLTS